MSFLLHVFAIVWSLMSITESNVIVQQLIEVFRLLSVILMGLYAYNEDKRKYS